MLRNVLLIYGNDSKWQDEAFYTTKTLLQKHSPSINQTFLHWGHKPLQNLLCLTPPHPFFSFLFFFLSFSNMHWVTRPFVAAHLKNTQSSPAWACSLSRAWMTATVIQMFQADSHQQGQIVGSVCLCQHSLGSRSLCQSVQHRREEFHLHPSCRKLLCSAGWIIYSLCVSFNLSGNKLLLMCPMPNESCVGGVPLFKSSHDQHLNSITSRCRHYLLFTSLFNRVTRQNSSSNPVRLESSWSRPCGHWPFRGNEAFCVVIECRWEAWVWWSF